MKQKSLKVWIAATMGVLALILSGCDSSDDSNNNLSLSTPSVTTPATPNSSSNDAAEIASLSIAPGADECNIIGTYGSLESYSQLPVNFQITGFSAGGVTTTIPTGEDNLDGFPGDHLQVRRTVNIAVSGNTVIRVEDGNGPWCSSLGNFYSQSDKVMVVHVKQGQAMSRTKLTSISDL